jgi:hypothetical protein
MRGANAAVGAGGAMTCECRAVDPLSLVIVAEYQHPGVDAAFARLADPVQRRAMIDNPHARCDGRGAERAADALLGAIASRG